ncbi:hypothetical protein TVAG_392730 [Trichomonas vaginalis G3]|uniref:Trafficking protein particle complex subunit n=1 Tax=Trichomonas vaginalis (strain ATCC PRA-98 / G3) TaxID=412133 RepID=A2DWX4_TRIV3|nr:hypothetical protein TVAGG3_0839100 [Trichomonas vaginalis G3]EAY15156.1 hypothetical protein TVAG_392730 [Trichomonas vaginalis G3]KAI5499153.1 hypothetical protein TVAGG3_0839100 [Trichomonas vaginalis G3]|eukprot:XP_001327379.1 hypothetical protein [Trichomonas vaginalis G3]
MDSSIELADLLVNELAKQIKLKYKDDVTCTNLVYLKLQNFGMKPGFAFAIQMVSTSLIESNLDNVVAYVGQVMGNEILGAPAEFSNDGDKFIKFQYNKELPSMFRRLGPITKQGMPPEQEFWLQVYGHFILGIYQGALLHFGYRTVGKFDFGDDSIQFSIKPEKLVGTWSSPPSVLLK